MRAPPARASAGCLRQRLPLGGRRGRCALERKGEVAGGLEALLRALLEAAGDEAREPRDAIERAWVGLEEGAADSGVRRLPAETPAEFTARVLARVAADRDAAQRFLALYQRARFSSAPVTADDVAAARSAVEALRVSWSSAPHVRPSTSADRFGARP